MNIVSSMFIFGRNENILFNQISRYTQLAQMDYRTSSHKNNQIKTYIARSYWKPIKLAFSFTKCPARLNVLEILFP